MIGGQPEAPPPSRGGGRRARALGALVCVALGCASSDAAPLPEESLGKTLVLAFLDERGALDRLELLASEGAPSRVPVTSGTRVELLAFALPASELFATPGPDGRIALAIDADPARSWPLPAPSGAWALADGAATPTEAEWLATARVTRPACPTLVTKRVRGLPASPTVSSAAVRDRELWLGVGAGEGGGVFRVSFDAETVARVPSVMATDMSSPPISYVDGELLWMMWGTDGSHDVVLGLDAAGNIAQTRTPTRTPLVLNGLDGVGEEVVARATNGDFFTLDRATGEWRTILRGPPLHECERDHFLVQAFDLVAPGRLVAALLDGPLVEIDLGSPGAAPRPVTFPPSTRLCRSALAAQPDGVSWFAARFGDRQAERGVLMWRWRDGEWAEDPTAVNARGLAAEGRYAIAAGDEDVFALLEHVETRPEIPPRRCATVPTDTIGITGITRLGGGAFMGFGRGGAIRVEIVPPP